MGYQVAFAYSEKTAAELESMGFRKQEVYIKQAPSAFPVPNGVSHSEHEKQLGDREFFAMQNPPFQFATVSYWGAGY